MTLDETQGGSIIYPGDAASAGTHLLARARYGERGASIRALAIDVPKMLDAIRLNLPIHLEQISERWPREGAEGLTGSTLAGIDDAGRYLPREVGGPPAEGGPPPRLVECPAVQQIAERRQAYESEACRARPQAG